MAHPNINILDADRTVVIGYGTSWSTERLDVILDIVSDPHPTKIASLPIQCLHKL